MMGLRWLTTNSAPWVPRLRVCMWLVSLAVLGWPVLATAHGGGVSQLTNVAFGPYWLFAWSSPESVRVGDLHISLLLLDAPSAQGSQDEPVLDANIQVTLSPLNQPGTPITKTAVNQETLGGFYYETDFNVPTPGRWQVAAAVTGKAGAGSATFELAVLPARRVNWPIALGGLVVLLVVSGLYG